MLTMNIISAATELPIHDGINEKAEMMMLRIIVPMPAVIGSAHFNLDDSAIL